MTTPQHKLFRITTIPLSLHKLLTNQLRYVSSYYQVVAVTSPGEFLDDVKKNEGIEAFTINMTRTISPAKDLVALWKLYRLLKKERPLIVHSHTLKAGLLAMLAAKAAGVPIRMQTVAGLQLLEIQGLKKHIFITVEKITYWCATKIYPNSFKLKEIITEMKLTKPSKIAVIANGSSNGINTDYFSPAQVSEEKKNELISSLDIKEDDVVYCFIGRIVGDKGINELVEAFDRLTKENNKIKLLLVGPIEHELDPLLPLTKEIIKNHPLIKWAGYQNDVRPYLAISDVFVFPSYREGFPNVVMQAGAMELPSIVSNINGCNEIIEPGKNGIIIPSKSSEELYSSMKNLLINNVLREQLASNSREMIINRYSQQIVWKELLKEYKSLEAKAGVIN